MVVTAKVEHYERFQGEWGSSLTDSLRCFMCKAKLYHTKWEHELILEGGQG